MKGKSLKILTTNRRPPSVQDIRTMFVKNLTKELKKHYENVQIIWLVYQPERVDFSSVNHPEYRVLNFHDYENAIDVIDSVKPDLIMAKTYFEFLNMSLLFAGKKLGIPIMTTFFGPASFYGSENKKVSLLSHSRLFISTRILADLTSKKSSRPFKAVPHFFKRYVFFVNTLKKLQFSLISIIQESIHIMKLRLSYFHPIHILFKGNLNFCSSEDWSKKLQKINFDKESIVVVGYPAFDDLYDRILELKNQKLARTKKLKILFAISPMHEHGFWSKKAEYDLVKNIVNRISKNTNYELTVKIHPSSSVLEEYYQLLNDVRDNINIVQSDDLLELIFSHDLMISYGGTSAVLYGVLTKKPIVFLNFYNDKRELLGFYDPSVMHECTSIEKLEQKIRDSLSKNVPDSSYDVYEKKITYKFDGQCSKRMAMKIFSYLSNTYL